MGNWTIDVDRERCMGSGLCLVYAPGVFEHDDGAKAFVADASGEPIATIRVAVEACPIGAIGLTFRAGA